ncbi:DUF2804 domain-containing protein [Clostridium oceanicum]|uniref:DUF2804 domain-containing protein n=1 Tax=Clostridium oceanicum TaxID=1543 RepID=A0ABN1JHS1_9CLOT
MSINKKYFDEKEIKEYKCLCDEKGYLSNESIGWAKKPIIDCNISKHLLRKKKWNYWYMVNDECLFSVTIVNVDYIGMVFTYLYDFTDGEFTEDTQVIPFALGCNMSKNVFDNMEFSNRKTNIFFKWEKENNIMKIIVNYNNFMRKKLTAYFNVIYSKDYETLNVVIPWNENRFQFTSKQNCIPVDGEVRLDEKSYKFYKENSFAGLDFGRGVWPFKIMWNWATFSGIQKDNLIGINLGGKWTDGTGITENAISINNKIIKLNENIIYDYDFNNLMGTWNIRTEISDKVNLQFHPLYDRISKTKFLILGSKVHQIIGEFSGYIRNKKEEKILIENIKGIAEEHNARW